MAPKIDRTVETITHDSDKRTNIPTAELQSVVENDRRLKTIRYPRNTDLDPQLVWRGKDEQDWSDLVVHAPPLYIQEKIHPKVLIDDLMKRSKETKEKQPGFEYDLFAAFNGVAESVDKTEFYQHDQNWTNRMILGDSLQVMASLAERESLRGKVQCIYFDPPYGIDFNSNFQWSTTDSSPIDEKADYITREPEQVKAFRDTWRDGVHSYLTYLRDRLTVARDLLAESGSIFVQIGIVNVHRVRAILDEILGPDSFITEIVVKKKGSQKGSFMDPVNDFILWYSRSRKSDKKLKFRTLYEQREMDSETINEFSRAELPSGESVNLKDWRDSNGEKVDFRSFPKRIATEFPGARLYRPWPITNGGSRPRQLDPVIFKGQPVSPPKGNCWRHTSKLLEDDKKSTLTGMDRNYVAGRLLRTKSTLDYKRFLDDFPYKTISNWWDGFGGAPDQIYIVQTNERIIERCILMATDPGDLVLDPTCGSGTTAYVAEQWGRRWITMDTSRVALALARCRIMGARFPYYLLTDSREGQLKESSVTQTPVRNIPTHQNIRHGFIYRRILQIMSGSYANTIEIDDIQKDAELNLNRLREKLNIAIGKVLQNWEIPKEAEAGWSKTAVSLHAEWLKADQKRLKDIDIAVSARAEQVYLYDRPYEDRKKIRVAGPFTVESLSPHRVLTVGGDDELIDPMKVRDAPKQSFAMMIIEALRVSGVQQAHKEDRINFTSLVSWPGDMICAEGIYMQGTVEKRAAIFIGPEFGTVQRADLVAAAREAGDAAFDVLISCAFSYEAHTTEFSKLGRLPVLKARMNADLHMADDLRNTGQGNLFIIFGDPDITIIPDSDDYLRVKVNGVDIYKPQTGKVQNDNIDDIACWFVDTDYNEESFFVRHAYFLGANDPYNALRMSLKAEIDVASWSTLCSDISRPFPKPKNGRIAVKVINNLGDEVMKIFKV